MKNYWVKNKFTDIEPHEVFLDKLAHAKEEELGLSEKKFEVPLKEKISYVLFAIFFLAAAALFSKTFYLQIFEGKKLYVSAENNKGSANIIVPERGIIYDKNLKKLVSNSPAFDLVCDRANFSVLTPEISKEISDIANSLKVNPSDVENKIKSSDSAQVLVAEDISHENLLVLETKMGGIFSCKIQQNTSRNYLFGPVLSQVLGYTGRINKNEYSSSSGYSINGYIGKTGLEKYYEPYLRGVPGQSRPGGARLASQSEAAKPEILSVPIAGNNLVLNIDIGLQQRLYDALGKSIEKMGGKKGAAVAMDPRTGAVLALVSYPSYDDNLFSKGISKTDYDKIVNDPSQPLFNRAVSAKYPTGSTIKPFEAAAALQENLISPTKQINDPGYILVKSQYDPSVVYRYGGVAPHGMVDMKKAIAVSSNIYFYTVGGGYGDQQGLGPARIKKYLSLFGWNEKTGIDLPGEFSGFIPDPAWKKATKGLSWFDGDTYNLSIGQSDLQTTPLQVTSAYCAIANGGTLYKPQIVKSIVGVKEFAPEIIRSNFIDPENLAIVRQGMRDGVAEDYGISKSLNDLPVAVAAKTGTAEIGYNNLFNVWSSVFAPYDNPEIVLVVTAENVNGLGAVTLPVARDVLQWYFSGKK
ncbi:MAG: penicillin-binding protein 2 [Candidatus Staskawiczbacteria bacterium RIFOXYD2_FULL_37_9]|uniref:Penicillin-binding protein 2 n=1 Tax=Candidatus Staskawiczbacteria bacterium RIFOXYB1_FULL_37_44 TaxID=1802223 RepID=A0A1G2IVS7_9BACT|nr:MAG: penicillin-binding protein 2 [Candidatus Staskawiczbacteria bacterium RIFOXYB1_FULL_37_44]OGZ83598.1 MAG: penicillin-binding protein 2 [Candidatus Staskawiczbacteria bacterium RIFOXYC1_FULL_37_52]OGZ88698.1 MAG: penicillin-binding protein 2 [Candidatus Staskawiczbacteria bacterium RIFOXYD1_FULL_37_110]OGZ89037.1 MAG: penicillin-binding protein 2 [Candidatus Staskawiczbacteria bacterium RIFOXYC2_FULL_37_19]OGZ93007.1 MAG: penicillin-binding protein 2 [Candidatus Staskawiczbacteria bacter